MASPTNTSDQPDDRTPLAVRHKRRGGALSCAECRRLKLKCSRVFPCSNCVKKGCSAICPDGSLTTGKGNRFVLANTEALHEKIAQLSNRVRQLEDALSQAHALLSNESHPLLSDELLKIKRPLERERLDVPAPTDQKIETNDAIDAMGSLSISQGGRSTFFGQTANSWYLLQNEEGSDNDDDAPNFEPPMPADVLWLNYAFPFTSTLSKTADGVRGSIIGLLPGSSHARKFCEIYYRHAAWMYTPIPETEFYETIFRPVYDPDAAYHEPIGSHSLAVLYMILALGTLLDLERPAHSPESTQYYQLGRAALTLDSVLEEQSIPGLQALLLMCHYMFLSDIEGQRWVVMGIVVKLAQSIGLHRDSGKWNLNPEETHKRQCLLWEIYVYDAWQSLTFGRPPSFSLCHIDCKMPHETTQNAAGEVEMSFSAWKHRFSSQCLSIVQDQAFGARTPNYKTIQELDKQVRTYYVPPSLQVPGFGGVKISVEPEQPTTELTMQRYIAFAIKEMTLFYMHRGFFAQALENNAIDPMGSKYAPSVLAAYTSACSFVGLIESLFKQHPALTERMWFLFTHVFSCAIVLGSIAAKSRMALAPSALSHLESAYNLFDRVSENPRTVKILPILHKLKERARAALSNAHPHAHAETPTRLSFFGPSVRNEVDELSALGGMTRLVSRRTSSAPSTPSYAGSSPSPPLVSPPQNSAHPTTFHPVAETSMSWQDYNHVQHFDDFSSYSVVPGPPQNDITLSYTGQDSQHAMTLDVMPEYYGYGFNDVPSLRGGLVPLQAAMQSPGEVTPAPDLNASWQNLVAQYKQV